ncbi:hypothetical protein [Maritalea porphyrae]|uniref:hypothetical protein n=1 Tax=Maritalea porphyrae TaxID=880732 RepID=UPI0022AEB819|nr:hypothetical protein [Maritalea porphyrae]MCZ4271278.1 hypothetical protein [Maritalea porphyrae]
MAHLGIDLSMSGVHELLVDANGALLRSVERHLETRCPHSGSSKHNPKHWIAALAGAMQD